MVKNFNMMVDSEIDNFFDRASEVKLKLLLDFEESEIEYTGKFMNIGKPETVRKKSMVVDVKKGKSGKSLF